MSENWNNDGMPDDTWFFAASKDQWRAHLVANAAEIARLREALRKIADNVPWTQLTPNACRNAYDDMRYIAKAALGSPEPQQRSDGK